jgi:hypothetical protein
MSRLLSLVSHSPSFVRLGLLAAAVALIRHHAPAPVAEILTVERVREAAEKNHYVPSIYAQTMRTKRFNNIFVIKGAN